MPIMPYWFILFAGALGADPATMRPTNSVGPFNSVTLCAAAAALAIDELNKKNPDKDFRASCSPSPEIARKPGEQLYNLQELVELAGPRTQ